MCSLLMEIEAEHELQQRQLDAEAASGPITPARKRSDTRGAHPQSQMYAFVDNADLWFLHGGIPATKRGCSRVMARQLASVARCAVAVTGTHWEPLLKYCLSTVKIVTSKLPCHVLRYDVGRGCAVPVRQLTHLDIAAHIKNDQLGSARELFLSAVLMAFTLTVAERMVLDYDMIRTFPLFWVTFDGHRS